MSNIKIGDKCPFTGKVIKNITLVPCSCECHKGNSIMHFIACCDGNGMNEIYGYEDFNLDDQSLKLIEALNNIKEE